jgi:uncharacterized protein (DUF2249 family)
MSVTIKIESNSIKAKTIINMLKALAEDYDFMQIIDDEDLPSLTDEEYQKRYEYTLNNMEKGQSWEEIKKRTLVSNKIMLTMACVSRKYLKVNHIHNYLKLNEV